MADITVLPINNIVSVTQGTDKIEGVRSAQITVNLGNFHPHLVEGKTYPSGMDNVGTPEFPVTTSMMFESSPAKALAALATAKGSLAIVYKAGNGGNNETITISNHKFIRVSGQQQLQSRGGITLEGVAHSGDGDTLPIA